MIMARIVIIMYVGTDMYEYNRVGTIIWAQMCLGTNVSGQKCVWA